jgi:tetratricopeptide (TPR) repeat protein
VLAQVYFYRHELDAFYAEGERTIALNPNNAALLAEFGGSLCYAGDERGIAFVRKAMKLDPLHPTWFYLSITVHHFERGEYEEALVAARRINIPRLYWPQIHLAAIYAQLGRQKEAESALGELLRLYPGFSIEILVEELRKYTDTDDRIQHYTAALRKAGLPE